MEYLTSDMNMHGTGADVGSVWGNQFRWGISPSLHLLATHAALMRTQSITL